MVRESRKRKFYSIDKLIYICRLSELTHTGLEWRDHALLRQVSYFCRFFCPIILHLVCLIIFAFRRERSNLRTNGFNVHFCRCFSRPKLIFLFSSIFKHFIYPEAVKSVLFVRSDFEFSLQIAYIPLNISYENFVLHQDVVDDFLYSRHLSP